MKKRGLMLLVPLPGCPFDPKFHSCPFPQTRPVEIGRGEGGPIGKSRLTIMGRRQRE